MLLERAMVDSGKDRQRTIRVTVMLHARNQASCATLTAWKDEYIVSLVIHVWFESNDAFMHKGLVKRFVSSSDYGSVLPKRTEGC